MKKNFLNKFKVEFVESLNIYWIKKILKKRVYELSRFWASVELSQTSVVWKKEKREQTIHTLVKTPDSVTSFGGFVSISDSIIS